MLRSVSSFVVVLSISAIVVAQQLPAAQRVAERFAEALSQGDSWTLRHILSPAATWSERDLYWQVASGEGEPERRARELIAGNVRLEIEVVGIVGDGRMVIAHERMWGDFVREGLAPLRSTTVYLVEGERLAGITRVLAAQQREMLLPAYFIGVWRVPDSVPYTRFEADGTYRHYLSRNAYESDDPDDSGSYVFEHGALNMVSGDDSKLCRPGARTPSLAEPLDQSRANINTLAFRNEIECEFYRQMAGSYAYVRLAED